MRNLLLGLTTAALLATLVAEAAAQWAPITARVHETTTITVDGNAASANKTTGDGYFYRASDGSTLYQWLGPDGRPSTGDLVDNKGLTVYKLDYSRMRATELLKLPSVRVPQDRPEKDWGLGHKYVEGFRCTVAPVSGVDGKSQIGTACWSSQYEFHLDKDSTLTLGKYSTHETMKLSDIHVGQEPDTKLFDIAKTFTVLKAVDPTK